MAESGIAAEGEMIGNLGIDRLLHGHGRGERPEDNAGLGPVYARSNQSPPGRDRPPIFGKDEISATPCPSRSRPRAFRDDRPVNLKVMM